MSAVLTVLVYAVLAVVVVGALVAIAVLVLPGTEQLAPAPPDRTPWALPAERAMTGPDVGRLRLPVTLRGYRFAETDAVLDRLGEEIAYRDTVIATLRSELEGRETPADAPVGSDEVWDPDPDELSGEPADAAAEELVELGETPEETELTEHVHDDLRPTPPPPRPELEVEARGPQVVSFDDEPLDLELPDGPAPRP